MAASKARRRAEPEFGGVLKGQNEGQLEMECPGRAHGPRPGKAGLRKVTRGRGRLI